MRFAVRLLSILAALVILMVSYPSRVFASTPDLGTQGMVTAGSSTAQTSGTCAFSATPAVGDVIYVLLDIDHPAAVSVTTPSGTWNQIDALTDNTNQYLISYWHVVTASDTSSFSFSWSTAYIWGLDCYDLSGVNASSPIGAHSMQTFASTTTPTTASISDASNSNDIPVAAFAHTSNVNCPTSIQSGWTQDTCGNGGNGLPPTAAHGPNTTSTNQSVSFSATWSTGFAGISSIVLFSPATSISSLPLTHAGGPHESVSIQTQTGTISAYAPSYMYFGNSSGGGGGDICGTSPITYCSGNTTTACGTVSGGQCQGGSTGSVLTNAGVRYAEMANQNYNTGYDPIEACPNPNDDNTSCKSLRYDDMFLPSCALGSGPEWDFLKATASTASDASYQHIVGDPHTPPDRYSYASVTCASGFNTTPSNSRIMTNILDTGTVSNDGAGTSDVRPAASTTWYQNASRINNDCPSAGTFEDNMFTKTTDEFPGNNAAQVTNFVKAAAQFFNHFSPCKTVPNYEAAAGSWLRNALGSYIASGCVNWSCQDPQTFCSNIGSGSWGVVGERWLSYASGSGELSWGDGTSPPNIVFEINTASQFFNSSGCNGMDFIALDGAYGSGAEDSRPTRDLLLATRMLLTPADYNGQQTSRSFVEWLYTEGATGGAGSDNQTPVYPEYGLNFVPSTAYTAWNAGSTPPTDGNGCNGSGFSGGVKDLVVACTGNDSIGGIGAVYGRNGECYKFGVDIGRCTVLINESKSAVSIQASWCSPACNTYPKVWWYYGSGPQTCLDDDGANLGTSSATCSDAAHTLNSAANAATGAWGESASFNGTSLPGLPSLPACQSAPTVVTSECAIIFLSQ